MYSILYLLRVDVRDCGVVVFGGWYCIGIVHCYGSTRGRQERKKEKKGRRRDKRDGGVIDILVYYYYEVREIDYEMVSGTEFTALLVLYCRQ